MTDSRFADILHTDYIPTGEDIEEIKTYIQDRQQDIDHIELEVQKHQAIINSLRAQSQLMRDAVDAHEAFIAPHRQLGDEAALVDAPKNLVAPHHRLTDDVLGEIFLHCLPDPYCWPPHPTPSPASPPMLLCHVCSRWRTIALSIPALWSSLQIETYDDPTKHLETGLVVVPKHVRDETVQTFLKRSGVLPLSLTLAHKLGAINNADLKHVLKSLEATWDRWEEVNLMWYGEGGRDVLDLPRHYHSNGESSALLSGVRRLGVRLEVKLGSGGGDIDSLEDSLEALSLGECTRLEELSLRCNFQSTSNILLPLAQYIPFHQLRILRLDHALDSLKCCGAWQVPFDTVIDILNRCTQLTGFLASFHTKLELADWTKLSCTNESLKALSLSGPYETQSSREPGYLSKINCPKLLHFTIRSHSIPSNLPHHTRAQFEFRRLRDMVFKVGTTLTSLTVDSIVDVTDILPCLPALVSLTLESYDSEGRKVPGSTSDEQEMMARHPSWRTSRKEVLLQLAGAREVWVSDVYEYGPRKSSNGFVLCPSLRYLKWEGHTFFEDGDLLYLLLMRWSDKRPFKQVHVVFSRPMQIDVVAKCGELVDGGLDLRLQYQISPQADSSDGLVD